MLPLMKRKLCLGAFLFVSMVFLAAAQDYAPPPAPSGPMLSGAQLNTLVGPIALYPDPLIAQVLPAATQPAQIAIAYNYVNSGGDPNAIDQQAWDSTVKAVARYPDVLKLLAENLPWTTQLGQAYLNQPTDVMNAIQALRAQAQQLGNLQNLPQENVVSDDGSIEILPSDPDTLYVPEYDPSLIFYTPCYGRSFITFGTGFRIGGWLDHDFDWHGRRLVTWGPGHPRPGNWWRETPATRREVIGRAPAWRAPVRPVGRPVVIRGGDRGYVNRDVHVEPARAEPPREVRPAPRPVEVHSAPARPVLAPREPARAPMSAFGNESAGEARASSSRGEASRAISRPAPAPARSSGGGGGGGGRKR